MTRSLLLAWRHRLLRTDGRYPRLALNLCIASLLLLALFAQLVFSAKVKSSTMDEPYHILNGVLWFTPHWQRVVFMGNPPLGNVLQALPIVALDDVRLPTDPAAWEVTSWRDLLQDLVSPFLWQINGERALRLVFLARLPIMGLALLLATGIYRWTCDLRGPAAGLLALLLAAFAPNLLAHGRLATTDLGTACSALWASYLYWRYTRRPGRVRLALAGVALGLALALKFSTVLLLPAFALLSLWNAFSHRGDGWPERLRRSTAELLVLVLIAALVLLAAFRFQPRALWAEYAFQREHLKGGHDAFLMGQYGGGWWFYFPVAFALKTPLPAMVLAIGGAIGLHRRRQYLAALLVPLAIFFGASVFSGLNLGYRYLLPVLPYLFVLAGGVVPAGNQSGSGPSLSDAVTVDGTTENRRWPRAVRTAFIALLLCWYVIGTLRVYPHYLAYFNELAGGPAAGGRYLVDSNLDWGQDLPGLRAYMASRGLEQVYLSWFGTAPPERYGVRQVPLPGVFPSRAEIQHRVYHPQRPLPGTYAISATLLQGVYFSERSKYAWFQAREPTDVIGHSLHVYDVPLIGGAPVSVGLSGVSLDQIDAETLDVAMGTNDLHLRWFDARGALVLPAGAPADIAGRRDAWFLVDDKKPLDPVLGDRFLGDDTVWGQRQATKNTTGHAAQGDSYTLYHLAGEDVERLSAPIPAAGEMPPGEMPAWWSPETRFPPDNDWQALPLPVAVGERLAFLGYERVPVMAGERRSCIRCLHPGDVVQLLTYWRVEQPFAPPLALFVHMLDAEGQVLGQHDGLSIDPVGLAAGDVWVQVHRFVIPIDTAPGQYPLEVGLYRPDTMQRWLMYQGGQAIADRLLLEPVRVLSDE